MEAWIKFANIVSGLVCSVLCFSMSAFCQPDDQWKQQNDKGNRYEGQFTFQISVPPIELIGFHGYLEDFESTTDSDVALTVRFFCHDKFDVLVTAQELIPQNNYWMQSKPQTCWNGWYLFEPWQVAGTLGRLGIQPDNLGVLVRLGKDSGSGDIAPAQLYHSSPPQNIRQYTAYFRPGKSLVNVRYALYEGCDEGYFLEEKLLGDQSAGVPFSVLFTLPNDLQGLVKFRIEGDSKGMIDAVPPSQEFCFYQTSTTP